MKKITTALLIVFSVIFLSCSKDDDSNANMGDLTLSGKVMSPNNSFPIPRAKVKVFRGETLIAEQTSDAIGNFSVPNLPKGELNVELSKGKFKRNLQIDMTADYELQSMERNLDVFPNMLVVTGYWDAIEDVLVDVGIVDPLTGVPAFDVVSGTTGRPAPHGQHIHNGQVAQRTGNVPSNVTFSFHDLLTDTALLSSYDIIFLNCGANDDFTADPVAVANLKTFIENGGIVYATDFTYEYLQAMFPNGDYLTFSTPEKAGNSVTANVQISDPNLLAWLQNQGIVVNPTVEINGFLPAWQMVDSFNAANVSDWVVADQVTYANTTFTNKALSFTYSYGCGGVFYSSFHTHGNNTSESTIEEMMNYFVFELSDLADCNTQN
jgi:hypothetical protein